MSLLQVAKREYIVANLHIVGHGCGAALRQ